MKCYSFQKYNPETMARAVGVALPVSPKQCIEITARIRRKTLAQAKKLLNDVISMEKPLELKRYTGGVGHKRGMGPGRYPVKACEAVLKIVESCEANAQFKGLNTGNMAIAHANAQFGTRQWHYGRQRRRVMKRTHIEIVLEEKGKGETDKKARKEKPALEDKKTEEKKYTEDKKPAEQKKSIEEKTQQQSKQHSKPVKKTENNEGNN